ncbi:acetylxylan esterase [Promicromonospora sukumoe]|uniref:Cephalosporin-C deacetylase n=1 Tax=Promicromonospora sukumoe TaxID=88382 RepID=A0A7W3J632_9MICO|nr:acetylxylan esterase [Promicromonospora sukumoe]MBA8806991.1 cephalosporin-C deacetylase [Promicromonospora sukumoe]
MTAPLSLPSPSLPSPYDRWFPGSPIDGTYGYGRDALLAVEPADEPDGYAALWRSWSARAREVAPEVVLEPVGRRGAHDVSVATFTADGGLRLRAWVALPAGVEPRVGVVHSHGYGGRDAPGFERVPRDAAVIFPVARGLGALNTGVGAPDTSALHVLHGIGSVETYTVGRSAVDLWHAASALLDVLGRRDPALGDLPLYFVGTSFGGGIGALAVPWDDRFVGATFEVPTFGQHDLRLRMPCTGSGEAVRHHVAGHPEAREVLAFHDASVAATYLRVPTRVECALWDVHVPPPGQFAVASGVRRAEAGGTSAHLELAVHSAGHAEYPGMARELATAFAATRAHVAAAVRRAAAPAPTAAG